MKITIIMIVVQQNKNVAEKIVALQCRCYGDA